MDTLNDLEKAALYYYVASGCKDKALVYQLANGSDKYNKLRDSSKKQTVWKWFDRYEVKEYIRVEEYNQEKKKRDLEESIRKNIAVEDPKSPKTGKMEDINFLNLDEFLQYANLQANNIQDEKEKRAWVEMIGKYMNFKESDEQEQQIKAYIPIVCEKCDLYNRCKTCKAEKCPI